MNRKKVIVLLAAVVILAVSGVSIYASQTPSTSHIMGNAFANANEQLSDPIVATYKDQEITQSLMEYEKQNMELIGGGSEVSDRDATNRLLMNLAMLDEAKSLGISVTNDEVNDALSAQHKNYDEIEEVREYIDDFCAAAGITIEQYFSIIEDQLPRVILRQKLRDELGKEYCEQHNLEFTKVNPPQQMQEYVDNYLNNLLTKYSAEITYYPVSEKE